ncbi:MAG: hypothetical protein KDC12_07640 [Flavobacteriales bacterium]|nr:hypothetical protein [Flavobacteriales bacterium]
MKNLTRLALCLYLLFSTADVFAQMNKVNSGLPVVGLVTQEGKRCKDALINVYDGNQLVNQFHTEKNGRFQLLLHTGKYYTIEVIKDKYVTKRIAFNTDMGNRRIDIPVYECDLDIVPEAIFDGIDIDDLDFPMAIVSYDADTRTFQHNEEYTTHMRTTYEELLMQGFDRNGMALNE